MQVDSQLNPLYQCEPSGCMHYFYSVAQGLDLILYNNVTSDHYGAGQYATCVKAGVTTFTKYIRGIDQGDFNVFPFEYRGVPGFDIRNPQRGLQVTPTQNLAFTFRPIPGYSHHFVSTNSSNFWYYPSNNHTLNYIEGRDQGRSWINTTTAVNGEVTNRFLNVFNNAYNNFTYSSGFPLLQSSGASSVHNDIGQPLGGDELFLQTINFTELLSCSTAPDTCPAVDSFVSVLVSPLSSIDTTPIRLSYKLPYNYLTKPKPVFQFSSTDSGNIYSSIFHFNQTIQVDHDSAANTFLYVNKKQLPACFVLDSMLFGNQKKPFSVLSSNGIDSFYYAKLGTLLGTYTFSFYGHLSCCVVDSNQQKMFKTPFQVAWSCDSFPTTLPPPSNVCDTPLQSTIQLTVLKANFQVLSKETQVEPKNYTNCDTLHFRYCVMSMGQGQLNKPIFYVTQPANTVWVGSPSWMLAGHPSVALTSSQISHQGNVWKIVLDTVLLQENTQLCLDFYLKANCIYTGLGPQVQLSAIKYCGDSILSVPYVFDSIARDTLPSKCSPNLATLSFTQTNVVCGGTATGSATVVVSGGGTPITYLWSNGATTASIQNLQAGTYTVSVQNSSGCVAGGNAGVSVTITQPAPFIISSAKTAVSCYGGNNGTINLTTTGGTGTKTYLWSNGASTASVSNLAAGTYTVTVKDANLCNATASITLSQPTTPLTLSVTATSVSCQGGNNGTATVSATGGTSPYTYKWSNTQSSTTATVTGLIAGIYTVTVKDANLCSATASIAVTQPATALALTTGFTAPSCNGGNNGQASVTATGGTGTKTYSWNTGATTASISNLTAGTYTVTVKDSNLCVATASVVVTQPAVLTIAITSTNSSCGNINDGTAIAIPIGGTSPYSFSWNNGASISNLTNLSVGTYKVTVTDKNGCKATGSVVVASNFVVTLLADTHNICVGGAVKLTASPAGCTYQWSNNVMNTANSNVGYGFGLFQGSNSYSVTATSPQGCVGADSTSIYIDIYCCSTKGQNGYNEFRVNNMDYSASTNLSTINGHYTNALMDTFYIWGKFIIDLSLSQTNKYFKMGPGAQIIVKDSVKFENCTFEVCGNYMWQGITVLNGASLSLLNCRVSDAMKAVNCQAGGNFSIINSQFNNNYIGLYTDKFNSATLDNTTFQTTVANLKMPYDTRTVGFIGVQAYSATAQNWLISNCTFDKWEIGMNIQNFNLTLRGNTQFKNMLRQSPSGATFSGTGIWITDRRTVGNSLTPLPPLLLDMQNVSFDNCHIAGVLDNMSGNVQGCVGTNLTNGFKSTRASYRGGGSPASQTLLFKNNTLTLNSAPNQLDAVINTGLSTQTSQNLPVTYTTCLFKYGILAQGTTPATITIDSNQINLPAYVSTLFYQDCSSNIASEGIRIEGLTSFQNGDISVTNNTIREGRVGARFIQVGLPSGTGALALSNNDFIYTAPYSNPYSRYSGTGVVFDFTRNVKLTCNEVNGNTSQSRLGFQLNVSANNLVQGNYSRLLQKGIQFNGACLMPDKFSLNKFESINIPINFTNGGFMGIQGQLPQAPSNGFLFCNTNAFNSNPPDRFYYNSSPANHVVPNAANYSNIIAYNKPSQVNTCHYSIIPNPMARLSNSDGEVTAIAEQLDKLENNYFSAYSDYMLKRDLYALLDADSTLTVNDTILQNVYDEFQANNVGLFEELENLQRKLDERLAAVSEEAKIDDFNYDTNLKDSLEQEEIQAERAKLNAAQPENIIEINQKEVFSILLNLAERKDDLLTEGEYTKLLEIANQCPLVGGQAVHSARVMLSMQGDHYDFDDRTNCALGMYKMAQEEEVFEELPTIETQVYAIYPNPTQDYVTIEYSAKDGTVLEIVVQDILGQQLSYQLADATAPSATIHVNTLASGIYFISIKANGKTIKSEKLIKE